MWNHGREMRALQSALDISMPQLYGSEIVDIQAYIRTPSRLRDRQLVLLQRPDPGRGEALFRAKELHRLSRAVGAWHRTGISSTIQRLRVSEIAGELWNHSENMTEACRPLRRRALSVGLTSSEEEP